MKMYQVSLTMDTLEAKSPEEAAKLFLGAIITGDWSGGMTFETRAASDHDTSPWEAPRLITLADDEVESALDWAFDPESPEGVWSGHPDPEDPDNFWIDDATGERVNAHTGQRTKIESDDLDGTSGQDRESYSDDQDRDSYS